MELLAREKGPESLGRLLKQIARTGSLDRALTRTYRLDLSELEQKLLDSLR